MKVLLFFIRIIVGAVFVLSGFVKAVDPLGSCYKFTDYFDKAFHMPDLAVLALPLAFVLAALEFTTGIMLIFKLKPRWAAWMSLIFMIVFTPLTLYIALTNPVHDCGCFGDFIVLDNWTTFWKNVVLLAMVIYIVIKRKQLDNPLSDNAELGIAAAVFCMCLIFQHMMLRHLPIFDFRPYKVGNNIAEKMVLPPDAKKEIREINFIYKNSVTGEEKVFAQEEIPWSDTTWVYSDRIEKEIQKGDVPEIHDFTMNDTTGYDHTQEVLNNEKPVLMVVMHKLDKADEDGLKMLLHLQNYAEQKGYRILALTSSNWEEIEAVKNKYSVDFEFFVADDITLKTIVRANPGIVKLEKGTVTRKWNFRDFKLTKDY